MNRSGRIIGMVIFVLGIIILLFVFAMAYSMFTAPASRILGTPAAGAVTAAGLGSALVVVLIRIGLLFIMTLAGSLIAARGIHLYLGSCELRRGE